MTFVGRFFLAVMVVSFTEMWLLLEMATRMGALTTIMACVVTGVVGGALVRREGIRTLTGIQREVQNGRVPADQLVGGAILFAVGALLLTPGFLTDTAGFLLLVPVIRIALSRQLIRWFQTRAVTGKKSKLVIETEAHRPPSPNQHKDS